MNIKKIDNKIGTSFETPKKKKRIPFILYLALPLLVAAIAATYMFVFSDKNVRAQSDTNDSSSKIISELSSEQQVLEQQKRKLEDYERNLKAFETELDRKNNDYLLKLKDLQTQNDALKAKEDTFNKKVDDKTVDRQTIEMYENIDPEQAAVLLKNLYDKDSQMTVLILRKIAGKKAGKILEAMIPLDKETSTKLAKESLDYYKKGL
jgi:flagellar motility protein MotE (MotC chaperone)